MKKYFEILQSIVSIVALIVFISAIAGFLTSFAYLLPRNYGNIELPLAEPNHIAVVNNGLIYCGLNIYNKIQVYDQNGNFVKGWFIESGGTGFGITINEDMIKIVTFANKHYFYDFNGNLLREEDHGDPTKSATYDEDLAGLKGNGKGPVYDKMENSYFIKSHWLFPKIIKKTSSGKEVILVSAPIYLAILKPKPAIGILIFMCLPYALIDRKLKRIKNLEDNKNI